MKRNQTISSLAACFLMGLLILDGKTALSGASDGIALAIGTLIPSLFPFIFLSIWLSSSFSGGQIGIFSVLGRAFRMPKGTEVLLIPGFLGGYPTGAQAVGHAYSTGRISRETGQRMLVFCNNAGPSFLFGMAAPFFPEVWMVWALWGFQMLGAWTAARLFPCSKATSVSLPAQNDPSPIAALKKSVSVMAMICGWVVLFRVMIAFLDRWFLWLVPDAVRTMLIGLLELSNGICALGSVEQIEIRFLLCCILLSFGGLCVTMQTISVTPGLRLREYFWGKMVQITVSVGCGAALFYSPVFLIIPLCLQISGISQKRSGNPRLIGV